MKRRETKSGREDAGRREVDVRAARTPAADADRLSGMTPDPERLSAVGRSPLLRAGSRWLSFARALARGPRRRHAAADTLAFIESLYGRKFAAVEAGAFSPDKVYRTTGGRLFVSETRLSVSVHPRFDLHLLNVSDLLEGPRVFRESQTRTAHTVPRAFRESAPQVFRESQTTTALTLLTHSRAGGREQTRAESRGANGGTAPSFTAHTWNVSNARTWNALTAHVWGVLPIHARGELQAHASNTLTTVAERILPGFGYVSTHGRRAQQARVLESARHLTRVERQSRGVAATSPSAETSWTPVASAPASFRLTSLDLRRHFTRAARQEFVSLFLNTHLPVIESREILSVRTAADSPGAYPIRATAQGETAGRFVHVNGVTWLQSPALTYAEPAPRRAPGRTVEIRREFRSVERVRERRVEMLREHAAAPHAPARDTRAPMSNVLPPASLLLSLSGTSLTLLAGGTHNAARANQHSSERARALTLRHPRTHTEPSAAREASSAVGATQVVMPGQAPRHRPTGTREALTSLNTFAGRVHPTFAGITKASYSTFLARPGIEAVLRRGFEQTSARQRGASSEETQSRALQSYATRSHTIQSHTIQSHLTQSHLTRSHTTQSHLTLSHMTQSHTTQGRTMQGHAASLGHFGAAGEFVRSSSVAWSTREASTRGAGAHVRPERTQDVLSTRGAPGAGTFLFASVLLRRTTAAPAAGAPLSPTGATALRLVAAAAGAGRGVWETRAARPEGMALELIRHRREDVLRLPQPGYVFTQPPRAQLEERQVITKASREEIVEVVRKEVRSLTSAAPAQATASRSDLAGIADEVYSTLVRRLLVEKERLGRL